MEKREIINRAHAICIVTFFKMFFVAGQILRQQKQISQVHHDFGLSIFTGDIQIRLNNATFGPQWKTSKYIQYIIVILCGLNIPF